MTSKFVCRIYCRNAVLQNRWYSEKPKPILGTNVRPDPATAQHDYIGPPDKDSNIRPVLRQIPPDETPLGRRLREKRNEVELWNQEFWSRHNKRYYEDREMFIKAHNDKGVEEIPADTMSVFYKDFLNKNRKLHIYYNISWYAKNLEMLVLSAQCGIQNIYRKLRKPKSA